MPVFVSVTVAVTVDVSPPAVILVGFADTAVLVVLVPIVSDEVPVLVLWAVSLVAYAPVIVNGEPVDVDGVKDMLHLEADEFSLMRVQEVEL